MKEKTGRAMRRIWAGLWVACAIAVSLSGCRPAAVDRAVLHEPNSAYAIAYPEKMLTLQAPLKSPQCFIYSVGEQKMIFSRGEKHVVYPGSTTKLLTALCALSWLSPAEEIRPGNELALVKKGSSVAYIKDYHCLTVEMLIEGMLLPSGNDAAYVLAAAAGRKIAKDPLLDGNRAVDVFMKQMKSYGTSIGLCGTNFTVPDGYAGNEHYSTTEDMLLIARKALETPLIAKYAAMASDHVVYASGHVNQWRNTNQLLQTDSLYYNSYVTGLKTGSCDGGYSLLFSFSFPDGRKYVAGVFGAKQSEHRYEDAVSLIGCVKGSTEFS